VGPSPGTADPIFLGKKLATFFGHVGRFYLFQSFTRVSPIISVMLPNMPKCAAAYSNDAVPISFCRDRLSHA